MSSGAFGTRAQPRGLPAREYAYLALREAIVSADLEPGRQLSENEIADRLGVSRTPVREALGRLRDERLVAIVPQLGTFVTLISQAALADAAFVREALECSAVRLASERADGAGLGALQANLTAQGRAADGGDTEAFDRLDEDLHRTICSLSGHEIAWTLSRRANGHLDRVRRLSLPDPAYRREMLVEHHAVISAIAERNPVEADRMLRHHLRMVLSAVPSLMARCPQYFDEDETSSATVVATAAMQDPPGLIRRGG